MVVYLSGPISGCSDEDANGWRDAVTKELEALGIVVLNPMRRDHRGNEQRYASAIVEEDKLDITMSDILLVHFGKNFARPGVGTSMEIILGWMLHKRIIVVHPAEAELSPWLTYHAHHLYTEMSSAVNKIQRILKDISGD